MRRLTQLHFLLLALALYFALSACDQAADPDQDGDVPHDGDTPQDGDGVEDGDAPSDGDIPEDGDSSVDGDTSEDGDLEVDADVSTDGDACDGVMLDSVRGQVIGRDGGALSGAMALVCLWNPAGRAICLQPAVTQADGFFERDIPAANACVDHAAVRLMNTADLTWTQLACPVEVGEGGIVVMPVPARLLSVSEAASRDLLGNPDDPHVITSAAGTRLIVTPSGLTMYDGAYADLRLLDWDDQTHGWPCFIDPENPPSGLVALVPELEVKVKGSVHIEFPNTAGLAAGTSVTLYGMGGAGTSTWEGEIIEEGAWAVIGQATVTEDETKIRSLGDGLPFYTWVGWRAE